MLLAAAEMARCLHKTWVPVLLNKEPSAVTELQGDCGFLREPMGWEESGGFGGTAATTAAAEKWWNGAVISQEDVEDVI